MGQYTKKGLYNKYDKNHKEREALDYYATPPAEVTNILSTLDIDFSGCSILEPCVGGGHMADSIAAYVEKNNQGPVLLIGTDIQDRGYRNDKWELHYGLDFFADDYPIGKADWVILNPPYSVVEPFMIRTLEIAQKGVIMFGRLQFLEGAGRYENILRDNPPSDVYVYVDRVQCWKGGVKPEGSSAQAYAWFLFDKTKPKNYGTQLHWIRRAGK